MKHKNRYDLPKGHINDSESELECALRELYEETGIQESNIEIHPTFKYSNTYYPKYKRFAGEIVEKTLVIFLAFLKLDKEVELSDTLMLEQNPDILPIFQRIRNHLELNHLSQFDQILEL